MKVTSVISQLDEYGESEAKRIQNDYVVIHLKCEIDSIESAESLIERVDNYPGSKLELTGTRKKSLWIVKIPLDEFSFIPPYLMDDWKSD